MNQATGVSAGETRGIRETCERLWHVRRGLEAAFFIAFLVLVFGLIFHKTAYDLYLDAALGKIIAQTGVFATSGIAAVTRPDALHLGWLWQLLAYGFVSLFGFAGLTGVTTILATAGFGVTLAAFRRSLNVVVAGLVLICAAYLGRGYLRPTGQAAGIFLFGALAALLVGALRSESRRIWLAVPLMLLWVNLDFTWTAGAALCAAFLPAVILSETPRKVEKALALAAALVVTLANPDFVRVYTVLGRLPLSAGSAEAWISPMGAPAEGGRNALYALAVLAVIVGFLARTPHVLALATASVLMMAAGLSRGSFPVAALGVMTTIAAGVYSIADAASRLAARNPGALAFLDRGLKPILRPLDDEYPLEEPTEAPAQAAGEAAGQTPDVRVYGASAAIAGIGLVALLALFGWTGAGSRQYVFGAGVHETPMPAKALAFAGNYGLEGRVLVHPNWAGYLLWSGYPKLRPIYDPRLLAVTPVSARLVAALFEERPTLKGEDIAQAFARVDMAFAVVPYTQKWSRQRTIARFWSPVYWDDSSVVFMPNLPGNATFIEKHSQRLTYPGLFGTGLTKENMPEVMRALEQKTKDDPNSALAEYELAMTYYVQRQYATAMQHLLISLGNDQSLPHAWNALGDIVRTTGSDEIAQGLLSAFAANPDTADAARKLSAAPPQARIDALALYLYSQATRYDGDFAISYVRLGNLYLKHNDVIGGLTALTRAIEADNRCPQLDAMRPGLRKELEAQLAAYKEALSKPRGAGIQSTEAGLQSSAPAAAPAPSAAPLEAPEATPVAE